MSPKLYMKSLSLENFRGFQNFSLEFHPRLNVFLGNNGVGKSSILDALSILLGTITEELGQNSAVKTTISYDDISVGWQKACIDGYLYAKENILMAACSQLYLKKGKKTVNSLTHSSPMLNYRKTLEEIILQPELKKNLPIFISYQANRHPNNTFISTETTNKTNLEINACYDEAISVNPNFATFFKWYKEKEDLENQTKVKNNNLAYMDRQLQVLRDAVEKSLGYNSFTVDRNHWTFNLVKNNQELSFNQLSDGEKGYLLLVADIARRLAIANPYLDNPLDGEGIVLIDEIELHLHPKWQREIISKLLETFTGCQFIITTHSPQIIGEVQPDSIWILEAGEEPYHPKRSYGMDASELLEEVMGAPSVNNYVTKQLEEIEELIDSEEYDEAREKIKALAKNTGAIPSLVGINALLDMYNQETVNLGE